MSGDKMMTLSELMESIQVKTLDEVNTYYGFGAPKLDCGGEDMPKEKLKIILDRMTLERQISLGKRISQNLAKRVRGYTEAEASKPEPV